MDELKKEIVAYWDKRAPSYTDVIEKNLAGPWENVWADYLTARFPEGKPEETRVLDVGTGPGFYAMILAARGYAVTAVDFSEKMLAEARHNAGALAEKIDFRQMDAQALTFPDGSFDVVVTRNLTWNLQDPAKAYEEWRRVLRDGGVLLNFDANWYSYLVDEDKQRAFERDRENSRLREVEDHEAYPDAPQMELISRSLPMTGRDRPRWDVDTLRALGFASVAAEPDAGEKVWNEEEAVNYASTPGFLIRAVK
jgi:ubiquinone/menaquinone biosynthesis C-methylase UbiE